MCALVGPVASLGLVSPGAATDDVTLFKKNWRPFLVIARSTVTTFLAVVSSPLPFSHVVYPGFFLNSATKKLISFRCNPLDGVTRGGPRPPPSDATTLAYPLPLSAATSKHFAYCIVAEVTEGVTTRQWCW